MVCGTFHKVWLDDGGFWVVDRLTHSNGRGIEGGASNHASGRVGGVRPAGQVSGPNVATPRAFEEMGGRGTDRIDRVYDDAVAETRRAPGCWNGLRRWAVVQGGGSCILSNFFTHNEILN